MRIPSDIKVNIPAPRPGLLEALGLRVGQVAEAQVVGHTPGGGTTVQIGGQQITLNLPLSPPPSLGDYLQFQVTSGGAKPQFALLTEANAPAQQQPSPPAGQQAAVTVTTGDPPSSSGTQAQTANPAPQPAGQPVPSSPSPLPSAPAAPASAPQAAPSLPEIALPPSVQAELNLQPGQLVTARVVTPGPNGHPQIAIGSQQFPASLPGNPPEGAILQFQADMSGSRPRLILQSQGEAVARQVIPGTLTALPQKPSGAPPLSVLARSTPAGSPQQALAQAASAAAARQDSTGNLLLSLTGLRAQGKPLPTPIADLAARLLARPIDLSRGAPATEILRGAVAGSGIFLETGLANAAAPPQPQADTKALLMLLRNMLGNWLGQEESGLTPGDKRPPPPLRGALPRGHLPQGGQLPQDASTRETARHLLHQTDAALSRLRLFQLSSMPEGGGRAHPAALQEWHFELPFLIGGQLSMAQFQVTRDPEQEADPAGRGWHMVFSIHFGRIGEVGARIAWRSRKTSIMLWAEEEETAEALEETISELANALQAAGLDPGSIRVRHGHPETPSPRPAGGFVDESS